MKTFFFFPVCVLLLFSTAHAHLDISGAVDLVAPVSLEDTKENRMHVRAVDLMLYGPVDPTFDGVLTLAGHKDAGEFKLDIHEGYVSSAKLVPDSKLRAGKFFLNAGRLNPVHQHDWLFVTAPKAQREFFSPGSTTLQAEGAADTGLEYSWLLPTERYWDVTIGVTDGYCYGHCHGAGTRPPRPVVYLHPLTFFNLDSGGDILAGATVLSRESASGTRTDLYGLETTYKFKEGKRTEWLVQTEAFYQVQNTPGVERSEKAGGYVFTQHGFSERFYLGMRVDLFSHLNKIFETTGERRKDLDYALVPTITYAPSEFSKLRFAYSHEVDTTQGDSDTTDRQVQFQFIYLLGAHPPHPF